MKRVALIVVVVVAVCTASFAGTSVASIKGPYNFQLSGVRNFFGYYNGGTFVPVSGACPSNQHCQSQAFATVFTGVVSFDGQGHVTFVSVSSVNGGGGSPDAGAVWVYDVSGYNGAMTGGQGSLYLTLGSFNSAGVATVLTLRTGNGNPLTGVATLQ